MTQPKPPGSGGFFFPSGPRSDWTVRAKLRVIVKRVLRKHGYPPDKQEEATKIVLQQAELLSAGWTDGGAVDGAQDDTERGFITAS